MNPIEKETILFLKSKGWLFKESKGKTCFYINKKLDEDNKSEFILSTIPWNHEFNSDNHPDSWGLQKHFESKGWKASLGYSQTDIEILVLEKPWREDLDGEITQSFYFELFKYFPHVNVEPPNIERAQPIDINKPPQWVIKFHFNKVKYLRSDSELAMHEIVKELNIPRQLIQELYLDETRLLAINIPNDYLNKEEVIINISKQLLSNKNIIGIKHEKFDHGLIYIEIQLKK